MIYTETEALQETLGPVQRLPQPDEPAPSSFRSLLQSAGRVQNTMLSAGAALGDALERRQVRTRTEALGFADRRYNALQDIGGYEANARAFRDSESPIETAAIKRRIDREREDRAILEAGGAGGVVAQIAAGIFDPINLIPFGRATTTSARLGEEVAGSALRAARTGALAATAAEGALQATQETRTGLESGLGIGAAAVLSGVLGGAAPLVRHMWGDLTNRVSHDLTIPGAGQVDPLEPNSIPITSGSAGAMATREMEAKIKGALGVEKLVKQASPILRTIQSPSGVTRRTAAQLAETPFYLTDNAAGVATPIAAETMVKRWQAPLAKALTELDDLYIAHKRGASMHKYSFADFKEEVGIAMRQEDVHAIPEVMQAAKRFRELVFDPLKKAAIRVGLLAEDVETVGAPSYLSRVYNAQKISAQRDEFVGRLSKWLGEDEAYRAQDVERQRRKMDPFSPSYRELNSVEIHEPLELRATAEDITDTILGVSDGRILYEHTPNARGPLLARVLRAPDHLLQDFLENDIELVSRFYTRTMAPDVELARAFGTPDMADTIGKIREDYQLAIGSAAGEGQRAKLGRQRDADIRDIEAMRDRLRNTYAAPADPNGFWVRAGRVIRNHNYISLMGSMTVSSIPDLGRTVMVHGVLSTLRDGVVPLITNLRGFKIAANEAKLAGGALDMVLDSRAMELADIGDVYGRHSRFERGLQSVVDRYGKWTLMSAWNASLKQFASVVTQHNLLRAALKADGMSGREVENLAMGGIDGDMAKRIAAQFTEHGDRNGSAWLANTQAWTDREAVRHFRAAILKDIDRIIVTPGIGDKPLFASTEMGKLITQFHAFAYASVQRVLISGLQQRDMAVLNGTLLSIGLGMGLYALHGKGEKKELADDPAVWVREGVDRAGILGWLYETGNIIEKFTRGAIGPRALSGGEVSLRYADRGIIGALLGPSIGRVEDVGKAIGGASTRDMHEGDVKAVRRLVPFQNLFYLRWLFDRAQEGATETLTH